MSWIRRNEVAMAIGSFVITTIVASYFIKIKVIEELANMFSNWTVIIASLALGVGAFSVLSRHARNMSKRSPERIYSLVLILGLFSIVITGLFGGKMAQNPYFYWIFDYLYTPTTSTIATFLAFFIFTASLRAFKARSFEAALMLTSAILVMLGNAPITAKIFPSVEPIKSWIMMVGNTVASRGITIATGIGVILMGLRVVLWIERAFYGGAE